jgi:MOSC domain-containing protein YiiM
MAHLNAEQLESGLEFVREAPAEQGSVRLIVRRTAVDQREVLAEGDLDPSEGLVGDDWHNRPSSSGEPDLFAQLTVMNARYTELIADSGEPDDWAQAGDQLYVDLDISEQSLPAGSRLSLGSAIIEISAEPHMGCAKFSARFGSDALKLANSKSGRTMRLRGANATVIQAGSVRAGDSVTRL